MNANKFLNALVSDKKEDAQSAFLSSLQDKINNTLDIRKVEIASNIMGEIQEGYKHTHQIVYTVPGEGKEKQYFHVTADDWRHAVEQLKDAQPTAEVHKINVLGHGASTQRGANNFKRSNEEVESLDETPTRKHFQQVADIIKNVEDPAKRKELAKHHADIFKSQNPRFDHGRFYAAAGVNEQVEDIEVHLYRGEKGTHKFPAENPARARQRAESLAWLHSAKYTQKNNVIHVHADEYYNRKNKKKVSEETINEASYENNNPFIKGADNAYIKFLDQRNAHNDGHPKNLLKKNCPDCREATIQKKKNTSEETVNEVSKKIRYSAYLARYAREARGIKAPGVQDSSDTLRAIKFKDGHRAMRGAIRRGNVLIRSRGFSRGRYSPSPFNEAAASPGSSPNNILANIRRATQMLKISGINPQIAARAHQDFAKLTSKNPKAPGYMLLRKLAPNKAASIQQLTQAGVPLGTALEANPNEFNQALQRIKRFK